MFESWFGEKLIPYLPKDRKKLIVLGNTKYHCRLMEKKTPSMKMRKNYMIEFMKKQNIAILESIPTKWNQYQQNQFYSVLPKKQMFWSNIILLITSPKFQAAQFSGCHLIAVC